jgi:uncharacterized protein (DUF983 family)
MPQQATPDPLLAQPEAATMRWAPNRAAAPNPWSRPGNLVAIRRGALGLCPSCGQTKLFTGWLRPVEECSNCHAPLGQIRADDAPPYFVVFIVGHFVIASQLALDSTLALSALAEAAVFLPITLALALLLLRPVKGATIGLMLQLGMFTPPTVMETLPTPRALPANSAGDNA